MLLTSRNPLSSLVITEGADPVPVGRPDGEDARELLSRRLGRPRIDQEPAAVVEFVEACAVFRRLRGS